MVLELSRFCFFSTSRRAGRRVAPLLAIEEKEMRIALWLRRGIACARSHLEYLAADYQVVMDQLFCSRRGRAELPVDGDLLSVDRCAELQEMGVSFHGNCSIPSRRPCVPPPGRPPPRPFASAPR